ncbi:MAG: hypothetical protein ACREV4_10380 [Gammaproteobacteria bacterium]
MAIDQVTKKALAAGRQQAKEVLEFRNKALKMRKSALKKKTRLHVRPEAAVIDAKLVQAAGGTGSAGVLVAEGDSWFDYPWNDVLSLLEDYHGYDVSSVAHRGDRVEHMAYNGGQLEEFTRTLEKLLRGNVIPKAILFSGGGNDVAGDEFGMLLNHHDSAIAGLNDPIVEGVIDRIRMAYLTILSAVTHVIEERIKQRIPILVHGYDYPVADGRGFLGGLGPLPGPWLEPGFRDKGYSQLPERIAIAKKLIDRFNDMLKKTVSIPELSHATYVDLRNTLSNASDYKKWWANELHPTPEGFKRVAAKFVGVIR